MMSESQLAMYQNMLAVATTKLRFHEFLLKNAQTQRNKTYDDYVNLYLIVDKLKEEAETNEQ